MSKDWPIYLGGRAISAGAKATVRNPFNNSTIGDVYQAGPEDIEEAIAAAARSFDTLRHWPAYRRAEACMHIHDGLKHRAEEFARCIALESGKPIRTARGEVARAITTFKVAAEEATRISGEQLPVDIDERARGYHAIVERVPIGPLSFFTPFNFPLNLVAHKVAPAMAAGCPFIVKPSERTPLTALLLAELLSHAKLPAGSWSVLPCDRAVALPLVTDDRLKVFSFTGSPEVGWKLKSIAGEKNVVLELGNNSAVIVEPDADLADAAPRIVSGSFSHAGQSCISVQRIYVHAAIADRLAAKLLEIIRTLVVGDPLDEKTDVGPLIDEPAAIRLEQWIRDSGGELMTGGLRKGSIITPALIRNPKPDSKLVREEAFGPVAIIEAYTDFDEVLRRVNNTRFGLQTGIFTRDLFKVRKAFLTLDVGGLVVNDVPTSRIDNMPYGGQKDSGLGREGVKYAIEHFTERKVLLTRYG